MLIHFCPFSPTEGVSPPELSSKSHVDLISALSRPQEVRQPLNLAGEIHLDLISAHFAYSGCVAS